MNAGALSGRQQTFDAIPASARSVRTFVGDELRRHDAAETMIRDFQLAVGELATNVVEHGDGSAMVILVHLDDPEWWDVEVISCAVAPPRRLLFPDTWTVAGPEQPGGRGLGIVRRLMDEVVVELTGGQLSVRCRHRR